MKKCLITILSFLVFSLPSFSSERIDYETFLTMSPSQQKEVIGLIMKAYATFEEVQKKDGITLEQKIKNKHSLNIIGKFLSAAYAQDIVFGPQPNPNQQAKAKKDSTNTNNKPFYDDFNNKGGNLTEAFKKLDEENEKRAAQFKKINAPQRVNDQLEYNKNKDNSKEKLKLFQEAIKKEIEAKKNSAKKNEIAKKDVPSNPKTASSNNTDNKNPNCIYAGWFSKLNPGSVTCKHPISTSAEYREVNNKSNLGINTSQTECKGMGGMVCNPYVFGYVGSDDNKSAICVAGNGKSYNSSLACWKKSNELDQDGEVSDNILKLAIAKPEEFKKVLDTIFDMCLCGKATTINDRYAARMQIHRTCFGLLKQAKSISNIVKSCYINEKGVLVQGSNTDENLNSFDSIHENLTNFFIDHDQKYGDFLKDIDSKLKTTEAELKALDVKYAQEWSHYAKADGEKCSYIKKTPKDEVVPEEVVDEPFDYKITIKFTEDIRTKFEAIAEAQITDGDGKEVTDLDAEGLKITWYLTSTSKEEKKEKKKEDPKETEIELPIDSTSDTVVADKIDKNGKPYAFEAKDIHFIRKKPIKPEDQKGYPVVAVLKKGDKEIKSNQLIVLPIMSQGPMPASGNRPIPKFNGSF